MKQLLKIAMFCVCFALLNISFAIAKTTHDVLLVVIPGCHYCSQAENILNQHGIKYSTKEGPGPAPQLYVDGQFKGSGVDVVQEWVNSNQ